MSKSSTIKLNMLGLPSIQTIDDFSRLTRLSKYTLYQLSIHSDKYYFTYSIPKKTSGVRIISQPSKKLKGLQAWILYYILSKLKSSNSCKGFDKGCSLTQNAEPHKDATAILTIDIKDFFSSVSSVSVYNIFKSAGYNQLISTVLSNICTYKGVLPQGGPCSPKLANLSLWQMDVRIQGYVGKRGINYTRYADDLTFSGLNPQKVSKIYPMIKYIVENESFEVNERKTRLAGASKAKIVTGLVISNNTYGVGRKKYKVLRAKIHHLTLASEQENYKLLNSVNGWISYLHNVDKVRYIKLSKYIKILSEQNPESLISKLIYKSAV